MPNPGVAGSDEPSRSPACRARIRRTAGCPAAVSVPAVGPAPSPGSSTVPCAGVVVPVGTVSSLASWRGERKGVAFISLQTPRGTPARSTPIPPSGAVARPPLRRNPDALHLGAAGHQTGSRAVADRAGEGPGHAATLRPTAP